MNLVHPSAIFSFLDESSLAALGPLALLVVSAVIFAETGLLIGFVLPGDTLLIVVGLLCHNPRFGLSIWIAAPAIALAAFLGGELGYLIGKRAGPSIFERRDSGFFSREQVDRTNRFFDRYGALAVVAARFVPIVRTFAPIAAGVGRMNYRRYSLYNLLGAVLWGLGLTFGGFLIGYIPPIAHFVRHYIDVILIGAVVVSVGPTIVHVLRNRQKARRAERDAALRTRPAE